MGTWLTNREKSKKPKFNSERIRGHVAGYNVESNIKASTLPTYFTNLKNNLPDNYAKSRTKHKTCGHCYFYKNSLCYLWRNRVKTPFLCDSWVDVHAPDRDEIISLTNGKRTWPMPDGHGDLLGGEGIVPGSNYGDDVGFDEFGRRIHLRKLDKDTENDEL